VEKIETEEQLILALSSERAVIVIHATWVAQSAHSFHDLKNWLNDWNALSPQSQLKGYWIDIDHESIREWVDKITEPKGKLGHDAESERFNDGCGRGIGPFMWIKSGEVVGFEHNAYAVGGPRYLTRRAQRIYNA
jgi:hypothetical protein